MKTDQLKQITALVSLFDDINRCDRGLGEFKKARIVVDSLNKNGLEIQPKGWAKYVA